jgi:hypothetical protein
VTIHTSTESLTRLALTIDADLGAVDELPTGDGSSLIRVTRTGEIAVRSLDGEHPYDALLGFVAPEDWEVFGVIAPGWGTYWGGPRKGERRRVRAIHIASRNGEEAGLLHFAGENQPAMQNAADSPGRVADCIRRALGLPTPDEPDASLLAFWWDRTLRSVAAKAHPANNGRLVQVGELDALIGEKPTSWDDERWAAITNGGTVLIDATLATWMDAGMFARTVLADMVDPDIAIDAAKRACSADAWTELLQRFAAAVLGSDWDELET